jgi:hypothetical protein
LPRDFGLKKPPGIDHLLRVKQETKMLEVISDIQVAEQSLLHAVVSMQTSLMFLFTNSLTFQYDLKGGDPQMALKEELLARIKTLSREDPTDAKLFNVIN